MIHQDIINGEELGDTHTGFQSIMLNKTPLDIVIEKVEDKYGSVGTAPASAIMTIHQVVRGMGMHVGNRYKNREKSSRFAHVNPKHLRIRVSPVPEDFKIWKNKKGQYCTNYRPLADTLRYTRLGYKAPVACKLGNFPYARFKSLHLREKGYIWHCGKINQRFYTIGAIIRDCQALHWHFGPMNWDDWTFNRFEGKVTSYNYFRRVYYRRSK